MPVRLVHPHVERCVVPVREPAVGLVELEGGDPEVEQDAERPCRSACSRAPSRCRRRRRGRRRSGRRTGPAAPPTSGRASTSRSRPMTRACRAAVEDRLGVAPHPERAVDADRTRLCQRRREEVDDAVAQHGDVPSAASPRLLIVSSRSVVLRSVWRCGGVVLGCGVRAGPAAGRPGGWSPSDPGPARGKSRRESGRLEAGSRVVGCRSSVGGRAAGRACGVGDVRAYRPRDHLLASPRSRRSTRA